MENHSPAATKNAPAARLAVIDLVRTVSILLVVVGHTFLVMGGNAGPLTSLFERLATNAGYGVTMFFVVSGFIITHTVAQQYGRLGQVSIRDFYRRRIARLLPLACITLALAAMVGIFAPSSVLHTSLFHESHAQFSPWFVLSFPMLIFNWALAASHIGNGWGVQWNIFWSLAIEEQFYLFYPFVLRHLGNNRLRLVWLLVVVASLGLPYRALIAAVAPGNFWLAFVGSPSGFEGIAIGVLAWHVFESGILNRLRTSFKVALCALAIEIIATIVLGPSLNTSAGALVFGPTAVALCTATFLVLTVGSRHEAQIPQLFRHPGRLSYGIYLLHPLIIFGLWELLGYHKPLFFIAAIVATVISVAALSWKWFESPLNKFLRSRLAPAISKAS
jgi:peptidoglycan/LPS O-acetylase OafA/YrhL